MKTHLAILAILTGLLMSVSNALAADYHFDATAGNDNHTGLSPGEAFQTLAKAGQLTLKEHDRLLLKRGETFKGSLVLKGQSGTALGPITIGVYGPNHAPMPAIDAKGHLAGVQLISCSHVIVDGLEITNDGGLIDKQADTERYGVLITAVDGDDCQGVSIVRCAIRNIFANTPVKHEGKNPTTSMGRGIGVFARGDGKLAHVSIQECDISRTGHIGILAGGGRAGLKPEDKRLRNLDIIDCKTTHTGGSGIQVGGTDQLVLRGNKVTHSGSYIDPRMHGRGSGFWPFSCTNVLVEHNEFRHARGKMDSCGVHIDYNCSFVTVQHNLSVDNEGGFCEILGNDHDVVYRYNISVNDGKRLKGKNGAVAHGKTIFLSGYVGKDKPIGPFNSYIYNNTIIAPEGQPAHFLFDRTTRNARIVNNIFVLPGRSELEEKRGKQKAEPDPDKMAVDFRGNVFLRADRVPGDWPIKITRSIVGDPGFAKPGSLDPADYRPTNAPLLRGKGVPVEPLPGSALTAGDLRVRKDFLGKPVPDSATPGAIEYATDPAK